MRLSPNSMSITAAYVFCTYTHESCCIVINLLNKTLLVELRSFSNNDFVTGYKLIDRSFHWEAGLPCLNQIMMDNNLYNDVRTIINFQALKEDSLLWWTPSVGESVQKPLTQWHGCILLNPDQQEFWHDRPGLSKDNELLRDTPGVHLQLSYEDLAVVTLVVLGQCHPPNSYLPTKYASVAAHLIWPAG